MGETKYAATEICRGTYAFGVIHLQVNINL